MVRTLHLAQKNWVRSPWQAESCQWKSHWKIIPGLGKRKLLNYDHDLDMRSPIFMAFMSKAALNTIICRFFIKLGQSLVSSMVEIWLCVQRNWVQSPEVPSHWNSAVSKEKWGRSKSVPWGIQSSYTCMDKCSSNSVFCSEKTSHVVWLVPIKKLKICMRYPWIASNYVSLMNHLQSSWASWDITTQKQGGRLL